MASRYAAVDASSSPPRVAVPRAYNAAVEFIDRNLARGRGGHPALVDDSGTWSYAALAERAARAGNALGALGAEMESRVLLCLPDGMDFAAAFWGAVRLGAVPVPVNTLLAPPEYDFLLRDSRARVLVVEAALYPRFAPVLAEQPHLRAVAVAGAESHGHPLLAELMAAASPHLDPAPTTADDVAFWLYSSGTTGPPKGVMHMHRSPVHTAALFGRGVLGIGEEDVVFSSSKLFFAYGLGNAMTFPFHAGATSVVSAARPTADAVLRVLHDAQPTVFYAVPTLYGALLSDPSWGRGAGSARLRLCVSAGEALPEEMGRRWQARSGVPVLDGLGSTEMLQTFLSNRPGDVCYGTTGRPVPGYEVKLVGEDGAGVPAGEMGELVVRGPSAALGYWNRRERSLATFQGPWTRLGDRFRVDEQGRYHYCGRGDDMLKVSGQWVSPFEVESALLAHGAVLEAAVVGRADGRGVVKPRAFVVARDPARVGSALAAELQRFARERLAPWKYPRWIEFLDALPKTATGKIQRYRLRERP